MNIMESTLGTVSIASRMTHLRAIAGQKNHTKISDHNNIKNERPQMVLIGHNNDVLNEFQDYLSDDFNLASFSSDSTTINWRQLQSVDVIVVNLDIKGLQVARLLKNNSSTSFIPLIFLKTEDNYPHERKGITLGAVDIISAPINFYILKFKVLNILKHLQIKNDVDTVKKLQQNCQDDDLILKTKELIQEHIDDRGLDVRKLSHLISQSPNYIYRRIKRKTGYTVKRFILLERLKVSAKLLKQTDRNVSEVAYMVGFDSPGYFSRCFKEYYHCSPKDFKAID